MEQKTIKNSNFSYEFIALGIVSIMFWIFIGIVIFTDNIDIGSFSLPQTNIQSIIIPIITIIVTIGYIVYLLFYINSLGNKIHEPKGLLYISFFIPLAGLILYCVYIKKEEKLAKACGKLAILGFTLPLVLVAIVLLGSIFNILSMGNL